MNEQLRRLAGKHIKVMLSGTGRDFWGPYVVGKVDPTGATVVLHGRNEYIVSIKHIVMVQPIEEQQ